METIKKLLKGAFLALGGVLVVAVVLGLLILAAMLGGLLMAFGWAIVAGVVVTVLVISGIRELFGSSRTRRKS